MKNLEPVSRINMPHHMACPAVRKLMDVLGRGASDPAALFVGGCVRNALMDEPPSDVDIATIWTPDEVVKLLEAQGIKVVPTGVDHGTVTAVIDGQNYEITTLRRDVETDGRRAVVAFTKDWAEDAQRRDFTINTLLCDMEGQIYDPSGQGMDDLHARRILFVGEPSERIAEDILRILRYFRFYGLYGRDAPDENTLKACAKAADQIETLSSERITQEFSKIIMGPRAAEIIMLMHDHDVLEHVLGFGLKEDLHAFDKDMGLEARLLKVCSLDEGLLDGLNERLSFSNKQKHRLRDLLSLLQSEEMNTEHSIKRALYFYGRDLAIQAHLMKGGVADEHFDLLMSWPVPEFPIKAADLMDQGLKPGPLLGKKLKELEAQWIEQGFPEEFRAS